MVFSHVVRIAKSYPLRFGMGYSVFKTSGVLRRGHRPL